MGREQFDGRALMPVLSEYANPRGKVTSLLRRGDIIRVKNGLYVFGDEHRRQPCLRELLADVILGPSFVSLGSALSSYGLISERIETRTSVTTKRATSSDAPIGFFICRQSPQGAFHLGTDRVEEGDAAFLVATPERALADRVRGDRGHALGNPERQRVTCLKTCDSTHRTFRGSIRGRAFPSKQCTEVEHA